MKKGSKMRKIKYSRKGRRKMARHGENIRKRSDGRWEARYIAGYREDGKARYCYLYAKTYAEVRDKKYMMMNQYSMGQETGSRKKVTVGQLLDDWIFYIRTDVKESTYARYSFLVRKHISPELGSIFLKNLTTEILDKFTRKKLGEGKLDHKGGLAPKTVAGLLSVIKLALEFGRERNYGCPSNITIHNPRQSMPEIQVLTPEEQKHLECRILGKYDLTHMGIMLSLYTGLRIGEICALRWEDFDFENNIIKVRRTIIRIQDVSPEAEKKTKIIIGQPKTECSNRTIPLPSFLQRFVKKYQRGEKDYILTAKQSYMEPRQYYVKYKKVMESCDLQGYNYHALRHTFATRCIENGFDVKSLSEILGHADVTITLRRYVHPSMKLKRQHMESLGNITFCGQNSGQ